MNFNIFQITLTNDTSKYSVELLSLSLDNILVQMRPLSGASRELDVGIGDVQLDNQMSFQGGFDFPVIFKGQDGLNREVAPLRLCEMRRAAEKVKEEALLRVTLVQEMWTSTTAKSLSVRLRPVSLFFEDTLLIQLNKIASIFNPTNLLMMPISKENKHFLPVDILWEVQQAANPLQV
jgi:hypothetical protein